MKRDSRTQNQTSNDLPPMIAWHVVERGEKSYWTRIGAVWEHGDGKGYNVDLDLMPIKTGRIVLRDRPDDNEG
jgi:hypothetical protein